jgi:hypothetical protein
MRQRGWVKLYEQFTYGAVGPRVASKTDTGVSSIIVHTLRCAVRVAWIAVATALVKGVLANIACNKLSHNTVKLHSYGYLRWCMLVSPCSKNLGTPALRDCSARWT